MATSWLLASMTVVTAMMVYLFAVAGLEAFAGVSLNDNGPGSSFDSFPDALLMCVQLLLNQNLGGTPPLQYPTHILP